MHASSPHRPRRYLVTRHPGAIEWLERKGILAEHIPHLTPELLGPGDEVIGNLPIQLVAEACRRGARYLHLAVDVPRELRGAELHAHMLEQLGARLVAYHCMEAVPANPGPRAGVI